LKAPTLLILSSAVALGACRGPRPAEGPAFVRLGERYQASAQPAGTNTAPPLAPHFSWSFAESALGWQAVAGVSGLAVQGGALTGTATEAFPVLHVEVKEAADQADLLHSIEVRARVSAGSNLTVGFDSAEKVDVPALLAKVREFPWKTRTPLVPGTEMRTYTLRRGSPMRASRMRHVFIVPTDAKGARFAIESVRLILRKEHLASIPSGVSWQGLSGTFQETLVTRSPEAVSLDVTMPERPWLDLSVGTVEDTPVTFVVSARPEGEASARTLLRRTVTAPHRWERVPLDLASLGRGKATLTLALETDQPGRLGFWGSPVVRSSGNRRGVIVLWADTLRADHLEPYGYARKTSPSLRRMAEEGTHFRNFVTQATWTKVSTPTLLTSLYPTSHGVREWMDRVPASAVTLAEVYRDAGYATFSFPANGFTGQLTNLHQGFEEVQEFDSLPREAHDKNARLGMDRLFSWLEVHRDVPFFAFLNFLDPHDPYKPYAPYDTMWADPAKAEAHEKDGKTVSKFIANPLLKQFAMATREELVKAGLDPAGYVAHDQDWYDGSIRAMDAEIGRLLERLRDMGLDRSTLVVFTSDHGEEFLEHGRMFHGQSAYGELNRVPFILWQPGTIPAGKAAGEVVGTIDVMPTLLELGGLRVPAEAQGQSLVPLLLAAPGSPARAWAGRPAITEKLLSKDEHHDSESFAIMADGWKLVRNVIRAPGMPEVELYDFEKDPLDQHDLSAQHPEVVRKLSAEMDAWKKQAEARRVKPDAEAARALSAEELERLRALGYLQ
jgi:arylsulfatase A-like enzyme